MPIRHHSDSNLLDQDDESSDDESSEGSDSDSDSVSANDVEQYRSLHSDNHSMDDVSEDKENIDHKMRRLRPFDSMR